MQIVTIIGNLTADPELRFTPSGDAVCNFSVADTARYYDKNANEWKDGETLFMRVNVWREYAENVAESLSKGDRVVVTGTLATRKWETKEGETRYATDLTATEVGAILRFATVRISKATGRDEEPAEPARNRRSSRR